MKNTLIGLILGIIITMWAFYVYIKKPVVKSELPVVTPTVAVVSDEILIKQALAQKYNLSVNQISTIFKEINSTQAAGTVSFLGEGGWFLAVKENNSWKIVADGNGTVSCEVVEPYNFPVSMVPECVDKNGKLIKF